MAETAPLRLAPTWQPTTGPLPLRADRPHGRHRRPAPISRARVRLAVLAAGVALRIPTGEPR